MILRSGKMNKEMNGVDKLIDSNILIYLSKNQLKLSTIAQPGDTLSISVITYMEVLGYSFSFDKEEEMVKTICDTLNIVHLDEKIVNEVIRIRKLVKIKLPDAIIAATAIVKGSKLITRNTDDFQIPGIQPEIFNPFDK